MNHLISAAACGLLLAAVPAHAQAPRASQRPSELNNRKAAERDKEVSLNGLSMSEMTPEMWFYMQETRRHDDAKAAVRRKAEFRTAQRQRRIAAREWFGYSNARPTANPDPYTAGYSPHWSANNAMRPDQWIGNSRTAAVRR